MRQLRVLNMYSSMRIYIRKAKVETATFTDISGYKIQPNLKFNAFELFYVTPNFMLMHRSKI